MRKSQMNSKKTNTDVMLRQAIEDNDIAQLKFVLRFERDKVNDYDENQMTALHWSCVYGRVQIVAILLDNGADIEMRDSKGWSALHFAANGGYLDVVQMLLESCIDVTATSYDGKLAIDVAQGEGMVFVLAIGFIKAGKEDLLLRYFGDSTTSLRSIEENQEDDSVYMSRHNLVAAEIWRASQQLLSKDMSLSAASKPAVKMSTSEYGICKNAATHSTENSAKQDAIQRKHLTPMVQRGQENTGHYMTLPRKQKLNNFDSAFSPGVLRRFAVSETNLNSPHTNNTTNTTLNKTNNYCALNSIDSDAFLTAEESRI